MNYHMKLSATGSRWVGTIGRIFDERTIALVIHYADGYARMRGGRQITRDDLNFASEQLAKESQWPQE